MAWTLCWEFTYKFGISVLRTLFGVWDEQHLQHTDFLGVWDICSTKERLLAGWTVREEAVFPSRFGSDLS